MSETETSKNVLLIGDEVEHSCRRTLARHGYQVDVATTGQEGLVRVQATGHDIIVLDALLPDISGIELLDLIRKRSANAIRIVIADSPTVDLALQAMKLGAYDLLTKPVSDDRLLLAIEQGLKERQLQREAFRLQFKEEEAWCMHQDDALLEGLERVQSLSMRKVAHELRAPLSAIRSFLTLILEGYVSPEKARHMQERAAERADDLLNLIDDVLDLAHLKDVHYPSATEMVSVEAVLKDVLALHTHEAEGKGLRVKVETRPCPAISADPDHISELWTNLISNAVKYTPKGGRVTVRLFVEDGTIVGEVRDTGIGIAQEDIPRLFQEFYRTDQAKAFAQRGTGLGLSIVKQIVQQYGGEIHCKSELGHGTLFTFRLPLTRSN